MKKVMKGAMIQKTIGEQLKEIHQESGKTCSQVIKDLKINRQVFFRLRKGQISNMEPLIRLAKYYGFNVWISIDRVTIK